MLNYSHTNFRYLSTPLKKRRMDSLRVRVTSAEGKLDNLRKKIDASTSSKGITVDDDLHQDLSKIVEEQTPSIHEQFTEGSFKRLFWEQQRQALINNSRQMRWHPTMIKWCLNIKLHSTAVYEAIRDSGFISPYLLLVPYEIIHIISKVALAFCPKSQSNSSRKRK